MCMALIMATGEPWVHSCGRSFIHKSYTAKHYSNSGEFQFGHIPFSLSNWQIHIVLLLGPMPWRCTIDSAGGGVSKGIGQMVCVNWQPHQCQDPGFHAVVDIACKPKQHHILTWKTGISHFYNIKAICHCLLLPVSVTNPKTCQSIHSQESGQAVTGSFSQPNILHDTRACTQIRTAKGQLQNIGLQCYVHSAKWGRGEHVCVEG